GIDFNNVKVEMGDSNFPPASVAGGSNQTATCCSTVMKACDALLARLNAAGGNAAAPRETTGRGSRSDLSAAFDRLGVSTIEEYAEFVPEEAQPSAVTKLFVNPIKKLYAGTPTLVGGSKGKKLMYALGAEFVEVRVHAQTCEIRVPRIVGA